LTKSDGKEDIILEKKIAAVNGNVPIIECCHRPCYLVAHQTGEIQPLEILRGKKVALFCAVASPEGFEKFVLGLGANVIYKKRYIDHHRFTGSELSWINERAQEADFLITTEKDAVRIGHHIQFTIPLFYIRVEVQFLRNGQWLRELLEGTLGKNPNLVA
ncbi:MAG: tetraacyldisaccharide 4'-kinase, partial [Puniceicoccales bacterium]|nr:tetraacyldisaccharide 4'-kinase [Puniceicoccales bacterium]